MKKLNHDQMLELRNQEFLVNMERLKLIGIKQQFKDRVIKNVSELLNHTNEASERFRIKEVRIQLETIKTII